MSQILTLRPARIDDHEFLYCLFYLTQVEKLQLFHLNQEAKDKLIALIYAGFERHYKTLAPAPDDRLILLGNEPIGRMIIPADARRDSVSRPRAPATAPQQRDRERSHRRTPDGVSDNKTPRASSGGQGRSRLEIVSEVGFL